MAERRSTACTLMDEAARRRCSLSELPGVRLLDGSGGRDGRTPADDEIFSNWRERSGIEFTAVGNLRDRYDENVEKTKDDPDYEEVLKRAFPKAYGTGEAEGEPAEPACDFLYTHRWRGGRGAARACSRGAESTRHAARWWLGGVTRHSPRSN